MKKHYMLFLLPLLVVISCQTDPPVEEESTSPSIPEVLPMNRIGLDNLGAFRTEGDNWQIAGGVQSDFLKEWDLILEGGTGILANQVDDQGLRNEAGDGSALFTNLEHGDIELKVKVLVPKGSNSGIYFQSRYELQIRDTAGDADVSSDDMGGIYAQWKDPADPGETIGGKAPAVNAARSPGLWQDLHVLFRAPVFDASGIKTSNARFEYVYLNGFVIHENVEVSSPTIEAAHEDETALAPIMIQGDHGPVAFKDFEYKVFGMGKINLANLSFKLYQGQYDYIPDFSAMQSVKSGSVENFDELTTLAGQNDGFSIVFEGELTVPKEGQYLFETSIDDGGNLYIDNQLVVHNQGEPGGGVERGLIYLKEGTHKFEQSYYQEVWGANLVVMSEGPGIEKSEIPHRNEVVDIPEWAIYKDLNIDVNDEPELIRGFADHNGIKKTHVLSVGTPSGINYSYDTRNNQLLNLWKGHFADVGRMWNNRGATQRLAPRNAVIDLEINERPEDCTPNGYSLDASGFPVFSYSCGGKNISDVTVPSANKGAIRTLTVNQGTTQIPIASGSFITSLSDGWYSIGNRYYIKPLGLKDQWIIEEDKISVTLSSGKETSYELFW